MIVFSNEWFEKYQKQLVWFANTKYGRWKLRINGDRSDVGKNKITKITPNAIFWTDGQQKAEFRTHAKFSKRLYHGFKPIWHLIHAWDIVVANNLNQALNLGFDTLTVYPDANPETTTFDGWARVEEPTGATLADFASRTTADDTFDSFFLTNVLLNTWPDATTNTFYQNTRGFALFNTSALTNSADITAADISFNMLGKENALGSPDLYIVPASNSSNTSMSASDYNNITRTELGSKVYSTFAQETYNVINLNSTGISNINLTGISKFGLMHSWDFNESFTGTWVDPGASIINSGFLLYSSDNSGTTKDPKLTITYTQPASVFFSSSNPYADGKMQTYNGSSWVDVAGSDIYFATYSTDGDTTVPQLSVDPSDIIRDALDYAQTNGSSITYDSSIDNTGTTVSYTFVSQSVLEVINKVLELSPSNWYYYIDPADNKLYFKAKNNIQDHSLTLGSDIKEMMIPKRSEDIINTVYFTGGDIGGGTLLYKKYQDSASIGTYGIRSIRVIDGRVTLASTAELISTRIIDTYKAPEVRLEVKLSDSNIESGGYDIESINPGDVINIRNVVGSSGSSLWDVALFDVDYFDFNILQLSTLYLQITRIEYSPTSVFLICSSVPPQINKRIEDIERNLEASLTVNNPDTPT